MNPGRALLLLAAALVFAGGRAASVFLGSSTISANVLQGCSPATVTAPLVYGGDGSKPDDSWANAIVLLDRGNLSFPQKVDNAIGRAALGVVIADSGPSPAGGFKGQLLPAGTFRPLPAFLVTQADGVTLKAAAGQTVTIGTSAPAPDAAGHDGETLIASGGRILFAKLIPIAGDASGTAKVGGALALLATTDVKGDGLTFQWSKDGAPISGATSNVLAIAAVSAGDAGAYSCTVTNSAGSATSSTFALTVAP